MAKRTFFDINHVLRFVPSGKDAHALRQFNFMNKSQPASVGFLLTELGFGLKFEKLPHSISGQLEPDSWSDKGYEVIVNSHHSRQRQRFSALHEVAHFYLHIDARDPLAPTKHRATGYTFDYVYDATGLEEETEANQWADALIFGGNALEAATCLLGRDVHALAKHFGFSTEVVTRALTRRGL